MKYPQLVSARAVSAISDWLVTQLEQLGVDSPLVYSRLLLSLLHTPLQLNALDLAEISDIKIGNCNRKGNNRRLSAADTETIKRVSAIDSLLEAVSSDQQVSKIESLIDELSEKLRDIENQNHLDESVFIQNDDVLEKMKENSSLEDPAKRYYRAFPALSKDITETSFPILSSTEGSAAVKSLSWPSTASAQSTSIKSSSGGVVIPNSITGIKKKPRKRRVNTTMSSANGANTSNKATASFARVPAHNHRGQTKKTASYWDTDFDGAWEMGRDLIREFVMQQNNRNRSISESDACNFFALDDGVHNANKRLNKEEMAADAGGLATGKLPESSSNMDDDDNLMQLAAAATSSIFNQNIGYNQRLNININSADSGTFSATSNITDTSILMLGNVIRSEGYATPDTMSAFAEPLYPPAPRRLYEREVSNESINAISANANGKPSSVTSNFDRNSDERNHFAAFKAKFNRNVEALWDDMDKDDNQTLTNVDPKQEETTGNVHSFWFNYNKHRYTGDEPPTNVTTGFASMYATQGGSDRSQYQDLPALSSLPNKPEKHSNLNQFYDVTAMNTGGGMNLTASIWSDNIANNESDVSFYANAAASWEKASTGKKTEQALKMNFINTEENRNMIADEYSTMGPSIESTMCGYDKSNFSKWSDCTFETPFVPTIGREPSISTQQSNAAEKIRKNMFENSYFSDFKSIQGITTYNPSSNTTGEHSHALAMPKQSTSELFHLNENPVETVKVTLSNHSKNSGFKEVIPSHSLLKPIERYNSQKKLDKFSPNEQQIGEEENLLTSEKTHFRPIKQTYCDGFSFEISNELENIKYHRSASGTLYLDSEVYREYYVYDEDIGDHSGRIANNVRRYQFCENLSKSRTAFVLKYCVKQNEKSCQTEDDEEALDFMVCSFNQSIGSSIQPLDRTNSSLTNSTTDMESELACFNNSTITRAQTFEHGNDKIQDDLNEKPFLLNIDKIQDDLIEKPFLLNIDKIQDDLIDKPFLLNIDKIQDDLIDKPFLLNIDKIQDDLIEKPFLLNMDKIQDDLIEKPFLLNIDKIQDDLIDKPFLLNIDKIQDDLIDKPFLLNIDKIQDDLIEKPFLLNMDKIQDDLIEKPFLLNIDKIQDDLIERPFLLNIDKSQDDLIERPFLLNIDKSQDDLIERPFLLNIDKNQDDLIERPFLLNIDKSHDDLIDRSFLVNIDGWTLAENRKRCQNNNNAHALWEHCTACTNDMISLPANRLLKDELSADGDAIMSDLKYMQNLYIGGDWEDEDCETDEDSDAIMQPVEINPKLDINIAIENKDGYNNEQPHVIYSNVSKLISDLLQPDIAMTLVQAIGEKCSTSFGCDSNEIPVNFAQTCTAPGFNRIVSRNDNELLFSSGNNNNNNNNMNNNHVIFFDELWSNNNNVKSTPGRKEISDSTAGGNENIWSSFVPFDKTDKSGNAKLPDSLLTFATLATNWEHSNLQKLWNRQSSDDGGMVAETIDTNDSMEAPRILQFDINQPSMSRPLTKTTEPAQSYSISNSDQQALQKYIDLANQKTETNQPADKTPLQHNCNISTAHNVNHRRTDRKRRHSATSQNLLEQFNLALANYGTNDGRNLDTAESSAKDDTDGDDYDPANSVSSTTIITCKYWATDSLYLASGLATCDQHRSQNIGHPHNGNATMTMHPTTILKHVAEMVTRPLTR